MTTAHSDPLAASPVEASARRVTAPAGASVAATAATSPGGILTLQRAAGNRAALATLSQRSGREETLARCTGECACGGSCDDVHRPFLDAERHLNRMAHQRHGRSPQDRGGGVVVATKPVGRKLLRLENPAAEPSTGEGQAARAPAGSSQVGDTTNFKPGFDVSRSQAREIVDSYITALAPFGAKVKPFPPDLIAANDDGAGRPTLQAWPANHTRALQRSSDGGLKAEAGFVGALQICYDLCSGEISVVGWVWAGGGVVTKGLFGGEGWWGAYVFAEKEFGRWKLDFMPRVDCGTCAAECKPGDDGAHWGAGVAPFPIMIKPGEKATLRKAGIEVGVLITPHLMRCDADLEVIALVDLTKYLGPIGAAVSSAADLATQMGKRWNIEVTCGVGVAVSGNVHLCKSVPGGGIAGITSDSAKLCGGGYVGCGIGLGKTKSDLHMG